MSPIRGRSSNTSTAPSRSPSTSADAAARVQLGGGQLQQRGLAGAVRAEHHPPLVQLHGPVDRPQQVRATAPHADARHPDDDVSAAGPGRVRSPAHPTIAVRQPRTRRARVRQDAGVTRPDEFLTDAEPPWPGRPFPLGATWDGEGTNFALWSLRRPRRSTLCLFDDGGAARRDADPADRVDLPRLARLPAPDRPGPALRLPRARAVSSRGDGLRYNPAKLLLDPYARAVDGRVHPAPGASTGTAPADEPEPQDSAPYVPRSVVVHDAFPWGDDTTGRRRPGTTPSSTSCTCKGFTARHPGVPGGAARAPTPGWRTRRRSSTCTGLGVTAVELLPVHHFVTEPHLLRRGPDQLLGLQHDRLLRPARRVRGQRPRGEQVREFKAMVRALHAAGIEVILDVVYNHTAEGDETGPTLSLPRHRQRRLLPARRRRPAPLPGLHRLRQHPRRAPPARAAAAHGLAALLGHRDARGRVPVRPRLGAGPLVPRRGQAVGVLRRRSTRTRWCRRVKLIAEPWDVGEGGYQVGEFPPLWTEWNGKYRDTVRDVLARRADRRARARPTGCPAPPTSTQDDGRRPYASHQLRHRARRVHAARPGRRTTQKHNEANGEGNRDGDDAQPVLELRGRGRDRRPGGQRAARPAGPQPADHPAAVDRGADARRRRRDRAAPRAATTTPTARTTRCPGWTGPAWTSRRWPTCWR